MFVPLGDPLFFQINCHWVTLNHVFIVTDASSVSVLFVTFYANIEKRELEFMKIAG